MDRIAIVPAKMEHAAAVARTMRACDWAEIEAAGVDAAVEPIEALRASVYARAGILDGRVAAVWGVGPIADHGRPWLLTADPICSVPVFRFARIYRDEVRHMLSLFYLLENWVDDRYVASQRMLRLAGFQVYEPEPFGPYGALFRRFEVVRG